MAAVLSGNRNFEGRIHPEVRLNYLASPPLVVAYALAGTMDLDLTSDPLGTDTDGLPVYLRDLWPTPSEVNEVIERAVTSEMFRTRYQSVFDGDDRWKNIATTEGHTFGIGTPIPRLCAAPAVLRAHQRRKSPRRLPTSSGPAVLAVPRRQRTNGPHLPGGFDPAELACRHLPHRARRRGLGVQLVRSPPGQSRGHDARDVRQRPPAQSARPRHRRWGHAVPARWRGDEHLRRRHALPGPGRPARGSGRPGVRVGVVPGLGRQGTRTPRRACRDRRELRAHPSLEPGGKWGSSPCSSPTGPRQSPSA